MINIFYHNFIELCKWKKLFVLILTSNLIIYDNEKILHGCLIGSFTKTEEMITLGA